MITDPSFFRAENALYVEYIFSISLEISELTELLSPPESEFPHVITEPSLLSAAKALPLENILVTPLVK